MDRVDDELAHLADLARWLRALDAGLDADDAPPDLPAVRTRLTARAIDEQMKAARRAEIARQQMELELRLASLVARAPATVPPVRPRPAPPPAAPTAPPWTPATFTIPPPLEVFWSPTPVLGFRAWRVGREVHGAVVPWAGPEYRASCLRLPEGPEKEGVPHTEGECGRPPCGIYAAKEARPLVDRPPVGGVRIAYGLVALSGKVVEHTAGYRAAVARVLALAVCDGDLVVALRHPDEVAAFFRNPMRVLAAWQRAGGAGQLRLDDDPAAPQAIRTATGAERDDVVVRMLEEARQSAVGPGDDPRTLQG